MSVHLRDLKNNQDLSYLKRNAIFVYEWCGPKELINLASPIATLKCCEDSESPKHLLAQAILKVTCVSGFCLETLSCCFDKVLRKGLSHNMLHIQVNISAPSRWVFHNTHCLAMFSTGCTQTRFFFFLVSHSFLSFAIELARKCCMI